VGFSSALDALRVGSVAGGFVIESSDRVSASKVEDGGD